MRMPSRLARLLAPSRFGRPDRAGAALVPSDDASGRSLAAVVAILTFLACLSAGTAELVARNSSRWTTALSQEATIQIRPRGGRNLEADLARAAALARAAPGIAGARVLPKGEAEGLLAPWLGTGLDLATLPVPGLVLLRLAEGARPDLSALRARVAAEIPAASVDDHGDWAARLSLFAGSIVGAAASVVLIVLAACGLAVAFATRGAMAGSRDVVEVLHLVGADEGFVVRQFAAGFLRIGLGGAALGAVAAGLFMATLSAILGSPEGDGASSATDALIGQLQPGIAGFGLMALICLMVGAVSGLVSARAVRRFLRGGPAG